MKFYTGVGSRRTPKKVLKIFARTSAFLDTRGFTLRSGGAQGADTAFESGSTNTQIFLPWRRFQSHPSPYFPESDTPLPWEAAEAITARFHPAWLRCSPPAMRLHTRNVFQVLGPTLDDPSDFLICWTPGGDDVGGTAQAIRIARHYDVPVCNLGAPDGEMQLEAVLKALS